MDQGVVWVPSGVLDILVVVVMVSADGYRVEQVVVQTHLSRPPRTMLRVRKGSYFVADCATVAEVARYVDLATLVPEQRTGA